MERMTEQTSPPTITDALWTVDDVAKFLNTSTSWVYQARRRGVLPSLKIGSAVRFHPDAIRAWVRGIATTLSTPGTIALPTCRGTRPARG